MEFPVVPAALAAGQTLLSFLGGRNQASQFEEQQRQLMAALDQYEKRAKQTAVESLMRALTGASRSAGRAARFRAASLGREGQSEGYERSATMPILNQGVDAIREMLMGISRQYDTARAQAAMQASNAPVEPGAADYLSELFGAGGNLYNMERILSALPKYGSTPSGVGDLSSQNIEVSPRSEASPGFALTNAVPVREALLNLPSVGSSQRPGPQQFPSSDAVDFLIKQFSSMLKGAGVPRLPGPRNPVFRSRTPGLFDSWR